MKFCRFSKLRGSVVVCCSQLGNRFALQTTEKTKKINHFLTRHEQTTRVPLVASMSEVANYRLMAVNNCLYCNMAIIESFYDITRIQNAEVHVLCIRTLNYLSASLDFTFSAIKSTRITLRSNATGQYAQYLRCP